MEWYVKPGVEWDYLVRNRPVAKEGQSGRMTPPPALKGHFSTDCSRVNVLNIVHL